MTLVIKSNCPSSFARTSTRQVLVLGLEKNACKVEHGDVFPAVHSRCWMKTEDWGLKNFKSPKWCLGMDTAAHGFVSSGWLAMCLMLSPVDPFLVTSGSRLNVICVSNWFKDLFAGKGHTENDLIWLQTEWERPDEEQKQSGTRSLIASHQPGGKP